MSDIAGRDPTRCINTAESAVTAAVTLLDCPDLNDPEWQVWKGFATGPLAAILYATSPAGVGGGIAAARRIAAQPDSGPDGATWLATAQRCGHNLLAVRLRRAAELHYRQRHSIKTVMIKALAAVPC